MPPNDENVHKHKPGFLRKLFRRAGEKPLHGPARVKTGSNSEDWSLAATVAPNPPAANSYLELTPERTTEGTTEGTKESVSTAVAAPLELEEKPYDEHSEGEPDLHDLHDIMLDEDADMFSHHTDPSMGFGAEGREENADFDALLAGVLAADLRFPKYIKATRKNNKSPRVLGNLFLAQELYGPGVRQTASGHMHDAESMCSGHMDGDLDTETEGKEGKAQMNASEILVMQFSRDGKYLAVAGRDTRITVWQVLLSPLSRLKYRSLEAARDEEKAGNGGGNNSSTNNNNSTGNGSYSTRNVRKSKLKVYNGAPVFLQEPVRVFEGHTKSVLCLDWSKNNFLLSGSMDKTVKLWNVDRAQCLDTFVHGDFVTALRFHPNDDRFFISGALDNQLRLWSILERSVAYTRDLGDNALITALEFTPWGNYCMVGGFNGSLFALETMGLHVVKRIELRQKGKINSTHSAHGTTISGIRVFENPTCTDLPGSQLEKWNVLITTNDSTIRLVDLLLRKLVTRFRGNSNHSSAIVASLSEDNRYIISGSEDHWCYVWDNNNSIINNKLRSSMKEVLLEHRNLLDEKHKRISRLFHDNRLWRKLPIHSFLEDENGKKYIANDNTSYASFHAHSSRVNVALFAPEKSKRLLHFSDDKIFDLVKRGTLLAESKGSENAVDAEKTWGSDHIIVTADVDGLIRVFRQDPAFYVRKNLLELKKLQKRDRSRIPMAPQRTNLVDSTSKNDFLMRARSKSPTIVDGPTCIRNRLQLKIRTPYTRTNSSNDAVSRTARLNSDLSRYA